MLADKIRELIDAGFSGLWVQSAEPDEAIAEIRQLASAEGYTIHGTDAATGELTTAPDGDPLAAGAGVDELAASDQYIVPGDVDDVDASAVRPLAQPGR